MKKFLGTARKDALAGVFGQVRTFLARFPQGKVVIQGDWNMGSEQLDQKLKASHLGLTRVPLAFGLDGTSSDVTFRQARKLSAAKGSTVAWGVDFMWCYTKTSRLFVLFDVCFHCEIGYVGPPFYLK